MRRYDLESNGVRLIGEATAERPDFLLLHAGGENRYVWRPVMARLARSGLGAIAFDQRGHGVSGGSPGDGVEAFAEDARRMLRAYPSARIVVGASLGGMAAVLALADERLQSRTAALVLVDVVPAPEPARAHSYLANQGDRIGGSPLVEDILMKSDRLLAAAERLRLPLLLVRAGGAGPLVDDDVARLRRLCPELKVAHVDEAGHLIARDAPHALAEHLLAFEQSSAVRSRRSVEAAY